MNRPPGRRDWLDALYGDTQARAAAEAFQAVFLMMRAAADAGAVESLTAFDLEWARSLAPTDVGRFDYLGDIVATARSQLISGGGDEDAERKRQLRDGLRLLRAVYRFGLLAWILNAALRSGGTEERLRVASVMAAHFTDGGDLTFVAGAALEVQFDPRIGWWRLVVQPRGDERFVSGEFASALLRAYVSVLMDLPQQPLPTDPWLEEYQTTLRDSIANAWPLREPSFWQGGEAAQRVMTDPAIAERRRVVAEILNEAFEAIVEERTMRVRRAPLHTDRVDLFRARARQSWLRHRTLAPTLTALGAPAAVAEAGLTVLVETTFPKAGFVGEASEVTIESYAEMAGIDAARAESQLLVAALQHEPCSTYDEPRGLEGEPLITRVRHAMKRMRDSGCNPTLILSANSYEVWSRLSANASAEQIKAHLASNGVPEYVLRFVRGRIDDATLISLPGLPDRNVLVIDPTNAIAVTSNDLARVRSRLRSRRRIPRRQKLNCYKDTTITPRARSHSSSTSVCSRLMYAWRSQCRTHSSSPPRSRASQSNLT